MNRTFCLKKRFWWLVAEPEITRIVVNGTPSTNANQGDDNLLALEGGG